MTEPKYIFYAPGSKVFIADDLRGTVISVCIHGADQYRVTYECSWWENRTYHKKWFESFEIQGIQGERERVGAGFVK